MDVNGSFSSWVLMSDFSPGGGRSKDVQFSSITEALSWSTGCQCGCEAQGECFDSCRSPPWWVCVWLQRTSSLVNQDVWCHPTNERGGDGMLLGAFCILFRRNYVAAIIRPSSIMTQFNHDPQSTQEWGMLTGSGGSFSETFLSSWCQFGLVLSLQPSEDLLFTDKGRPCWPLLAPEAPRECKCVH